MISQPSYESTTSASERVAWKLDDVLAEDDRFDFGRTFLPERMVQAEQLPFLSAAERRTLNHVRAHGYLCLFGLVEEFILPYVLKQAQARLLAPSDELRSLLQFASEEAKHIALFRRFRTAFERGFSRHLAVIGPATSIADHVLSHSELGVGLFILHIEWMTQCHYLDMVRDDMALEGRFRSLLQHHWLEECQHARIDGWVVERTAAQLSDAERDAGIAEYLGLCSFLDAGLKQQVALDLEGLERALGRTFSVLEREAFVRQQHRSQRRVFVTSGITHPRFIQVVERIQPSARNTLAEATRLYC